MKRDNPKPTSKAGTRRGAQRFGAALAGASVLSGCYFSDEPPEPEVQPLEIIAGEPDPKYEPCVLNVDEVGAGTHEVMPISVEGRATVRILDPEGDVIFKRTVDDDDGADSTIPPEWERSVGLQPGNHRVECILPDGTHTVELLVVPARPESKNSGTG